MGLPIFPLLPLPGSTQRTWDWGEAVVRYDSGEMQGSTPYLKPLLQWTIPLSLYTEIKQSSLEAFQNATKGMASPFLLKDAYAYQVPSVMAVRSGITTGTLFFYDTNSYMVRPDTTTVGSLFSALSGYVTAGLEYGIEQDTGIVTVNTKAINDVWGVRSMEYFRKARMTSPYAETSLLWNIFQSALMLQELP